MPIASITLGFLPLVSSSRTLPGAQMAAYMAPCTTIRGIFLTGVCGRLLKSDDADDSFTR